MKILAYIDLSFPSDGIRAQPEDKDDTIGRLQTALEKFSKIPGLMEFHFVYGKESDAFPAIAKVEVDDIPQITNVINEIKKILPIKNLTTLIVQPQLRAGERPKNPNFV